MIRSGPFAGMRYVDTATEGALVPRLLGTYESELHPYLKRFAAEGCEDVIDVGCAEGYYAVGLARLMPGALVHGGDDIISPPEHSVVMYLALRRAGVPAELHIYAATAHDFGVRPSDHPCSTWMQACANWLRYQGFLKPSGSR